MQIKGMLKSQESRILRMTQTFVILLPMMTVQVVSLHEIEDLGGQHEHRGPIVNEGGAQQEPAVIPLESVVGLAYSLATYWGFLYDCR